MNNSEVIKNKSRKFITDDDQNIGTLNTEEIQRE